MIELPKDAEGREIPLDTKVLYNEDGKCFKINRFTYSVVQTMPGLKWGVVFMDCQYDYCSSFYLTPPETPDSWEKLEEDLGKIANHQTEVVCPYYDREIKDCEGCKLEGYGCSCSHAFLKDVMARIRKLRGED